MVYSICYFPVPAGCDNDLEICRRIIYLSFYDIYNFTFVRMVVKSSKMRIAGMATSILSLLYQISIKNWAGLLEIIVICSNAASFTKYKNEKCG